MSGRNLYLVALGGLAGLATISTTFAQGRVYESTEHDFRVVTVAEDIQHPWSIAFLPDGDMLFTQRTGELRIVRDGKLLPDPVAGVPEVRVINQGGLQEVAVHPDFENNRIVYLSYSKPDGARGTTALTRARFENDRLNDVEEIFEASAWNGTGGHFGAKIAFDEDGYLFMSVGDRQSPPRGNLERHPAQELSSHFGTIVRLRDDGSVPDDNPFVGHATALPEIWSYGHRNPQGLAFHPDTGDLWSTEHGPQGGDELNLILPGVNYGWPVIGYGVNYRSGTPIHASGEREGMEQPRTFWIPSIGASGLIVYDGDAFPEWRGDIFAGGLAATHRRLSRITVDDDGRVMTQESLLHGVYRIREVRQGPDGFIYLATDNRAGGLTDIVRMEPATPATY
ncbi:MAG: PQQ-dependent sugar dehydrogenase [Rhodospirillaceae bacterium]|nr:PQQ-dependent sugar dehydrogenase [Rhodospirillaceae bacterium]MDD9999306.1 PQQ-dependent sugar dehydrogenase [Rhodospirillaceae bacterium]MDE0361635.1 PQQ-dependent sugar dehydrogenase [Rhodospirillaceae bacterium]